MLVNATNFIVESGAEPQSFKASSSGATYDTGMVDSTHSTCSPSPTLYVDDAREHLLKALPQRSFSVKKVSHVRSGDSRAKYCDVIFSTNTQQITMFFDIYLMVQSIML